MTKYSEERDWRPALHELAQARGFNPKAKKFWFLRHGESVGNATGIVQGQSCWGLSDLGFAQAEDVPQLFAGAPFQRIVSSDLKRVRQTISPLLKTRNSAVEYTADFRECCFGGYEGEPIPKNLWFVTDRNTETLGVFVERILAAAEKHLTDDHTLISAHGGVLHALYGAMGLTLDPWMRANAVPIEFTRTKEGSWGFEAIRPTLQSRTTAVS